MSERTFWRYIKFAVDKLGYKFNIKDGYYLDETFSKMKPATIEKVKDVANEVLKLQAKEKTKSGVYQELIERTGNLSAIIHKFNQA